MPCDTPAVATLPLLGCCGSTLTAPVLDWVLVATLREQASAFIPPEPAQVFAACMAEPFIEGRKTFRLEPNGQLTPITGFDTAGECYPQPLTFVGGSGLGTLALNGFVRERFAANNENAFAMKLRWRLPWSRRWCVTSCQHIVLTVPADCFRSNCDDALGNIATTLLPASNQLEILPDPFNYVERWSEFGPLVDKRDFTTKIAVWDTDPPSSPFCGLP